ncbi:MAG TPA: hypothetical protein VGY49_05380 [Burkholderiaceae bacterium]|jgi:hypothetical protein|nr:hypothetical protein [Burkholderiaceae bacterium]
MMNDRLPRLVRSGALALLCVSVAGTVLALAAEDEGSDEGGIGRTVPKAVCGAEDNPETGLQGQVPAPLRAAGFQGFNCNLKLIGQSRNDGGNWQTAEFKERRQALGNSEDGDRGDKPLHICGYYGSQSPTLSPKTRDPVTYGVRVVDLTDARKPELTGYLQTSAMLDPWESLKVNERRQLLVADQGANGGGGPAVDVYDVSLDCRSPQLLASIAVGTGIDGGTPAAVAPIGHEGAFAPDGLTYYIGDTTHRSYHAVDLTDPTRPKYITTFDMKTIGLAAHGLSVSNDGNRLYGVAPSIPASAADLTNPNVAPTNGFVILDTSEVQARLPNPQIKVISRFLFKDGSVAQHTIPVTIRGKPYIIHVDEGGSGGLFYAGWSGACAAGFPPFPMARIVDISDETKPKLTSELVLEMNAAGKCASVLPDLVGLSIFTYGTHYCSVDNRNNATTLACGMFNSGLRVFDIRNPRRPKEIAYFYPAGVATLSGGSNHPLGNNFVPGGPDWCSAQVHLDADRGTVWSTCQDNGLLMLKFERGVWPFPDSTTPPGEQN